MLTPHIFGFNPGDCSFFKICRTKLLKLDAISLILIFYFIFRHNASSELDFCFSE